MTVVMITVIIKRQLCGVGISSVVGVSVMSVKVVLNVKKCLLIYVVSPTLHHQHKILLRQHFLYRKGVYSESISQVLIMLP